MVCLKKKKHKKKNKTRSWQKTSILANYGKLIFVFPSKQKSSASSTEALKSKYLVTVLCWWGRILFAWKLELDSDLTTIFKERDKKYILLNATLFASLIFEVSRLLRTFPIFLLPSSPYIHKHTYKYMCIFTHTKKKYLHSTNPIFFSLRLACIFTVWSSYFFLFSCFLYCFSDLSKHIYSSFLSYICMIILD